MRKAVTAKQQQAREYIEANASTMSDRDMALALDMTRNNVKHIRLRLGKKRSPLEILDLRYERQKSSGWLRRSRNAHNRYI